MIQKILNTPCGVGKDTARVVTGLLCIMPVSPARMVPQVTEFFFDASSISMACRARIGEMEAGKNEGDELNSKGKRK